MTAERSRTMRPRPSSSRGRVRRAVSHHEDHAHDQDHYQDHDCDQDQDDLDHDDDHGQDDDQNGGNVNKRENE